MIAALRSRSSGTPNQISPPTGRAPPQSSDAGCTFCAAKSLSNFLGTNRAVILSVAKDLLYLFRRSTQILRHYAPQDDKMETEPLLPPAGGERRRDLLQSTHI